MWLSTKHFSALCASEALRIRICLRHATAWKDKFLAKTRAGDHGMRNVKQFYVTFLITVIYTVQSVTLFNISEICFMSKICQKKFQCKELKLTFCPYLGPDLHMYCVTPPPPPLITSTPKRLAYTQTRGAVPLIHVITLDNYFCT